MTKSEEDREQAADEALLLAIASGDSRAFEVFLPRYLDRIHGYLLRLTGVAADAEDLAQETFLRVWRKAGSFEPGRVKVSTWLHTIAHNLAIDSFRKRRETLLEQLPEAADELADPARQFASRETSALLEAALAALPENQRAAVLLCQLQGFSNAEAAEVLGVGLRALESLLARARRSLKGALTSNGEAAAS
ncbi:MAG: sigma-70 family RNA polymerase sigma factor [Pseudomonadota bacterium]